MRVVLLSLQFNLKTAVDSRLCEIPGVRLEYSLVLDLEEDRRDESGRAQFGLDARDEWMHPRAVEANVDFHRTERSGGLADVGVELRCVRAGFGGWRVHDGFELGWG